LIAGLALAAQVMLHASSMYTPIATINASQREVMYSILLHTAVSAVDQGILNAAVSVTLGEEYAVC
jgi:hypothetical protein